MKRFALPLLALLAIGLGSVAAQNITKSVQLSQDGSGPIGFDTNNNVIFPAHINNSGSVPTLGGTGCGTATIAGSDSAGRLNGSATTGNGAALCSINFRQPFATTPFCVATTQNPATSPLAYNVVATGLNLTTITGAVTANWVCSAGAGN